MIIKCTPVNYFKSAEPTLKESWKWLKKALEEFMKARMKLNHKRKKVKELKNVIDKNALN